MTAQELEPSAFEVGDAFAKQYYTVLQQSPGLVYRFYQDVSLLGRAGVGGYLNSISTMDAIDEKIKSYGSLRTDIKFVDAQESYNGGVIVVVAGLMLNEDGLRRGFTQTFFLAPQDKGYYVLNDIFRYVEDIYHDEEQDTFLAPNTHINFSEEQDGVVAPTTPSPGETPPVQENHLSDNSNDSNGGVCDIHQDCEVPVEEVEHVKKEDEQEKEPEPEPEPVAEVVDPDESWNVAEPIAKVEPEPVAEVIDPDPSWKVAEPIAKVEEAPKRSYASIVMEAVPPVLSSPNLPKSVPVKQEEQVHVAPPLLSNGAPLSSNAEMAYKGILQDPEGSGYGIFLRNLPGYIPAHVVEKALQRFGPVKSHSIQIVNSKGFCYGFADFEDAAGAQNAIEASPITIDGREIDVEEKRSCNSRGNYRGRHTTGRGGGSFRGEGSRGRGPYGGGRGYGYGENSRNDFGGRGRSRGDHKRNEGHQRSDQTENGYGRVNRGGGSVRAHSRTPKVSAQA